ncbi:hypothetical protein NE237_027196 [Protea cynaroides]|uniref:Uncharacterized protein n=1 Tax=Protea cynaroides TaxID=273540 RepID=A0A9Q0GRE1_9MAGN|nr:hypothetical protein NE237_027196 [Protea cynaroides]
MYDVVFIDMQEMATSAVLWTKVESLSTAYKEAKIARMEALKIYDHQSQLVLNILNEVKKLKTDHAEERKHHKEVQALVQQVKDESIAKEKKAKEEGRKLQFVLALADGDIVTLRANVLLATSQMKKIQTDLMYNETTTTKKKKKKKRAIGPALSKFKISEEGH